MSISKHQCRDFAIVAALVTAIIAATTDSHRALLTTIILLLLAALVPKIYHPMAWVWFKMARILEKGASAILLTVVYYLVVCPVGIVRRLSGKASTRIKQDSTESYFHAEDKTYSSEDLTKQF